MRRLGDHVKSGQGRTDEEMWLIFVIASSRLVGFYAFLLALLVIPVSVDSLKECEYEYWVFK